MTDITIITCQAYDKPKNITPYTQNILDEAHLLMEALKMKGLTVDRTYWDNPNYDWSQTRAVVFRTVWDYFERFEEFWPWVEKVQKVTQLINPISLLKWNIDKHYLKDLAALGIEGVPTYFVDSNKYQTLSDVCHKMQWGDIVIKPAISGAAFTISQVIKGHIESGNSTSVFCTSQI